jgi:hypothetical protein
MITVDMSIECCRIARSNGKDDLKEIKASRIDTDSTSVFSMTLQKR